MEPEIQTSGIAETQQKLLDLLQNVRNANVKAITLICSELQSTMKDTYIGAGHPDHPNIITGRLKNSILVNIDQTSEDVVNGTVYSNAEYAPYVEYGHSQEAGRFVPALGKRLVQPNVKAYPFFRPAVLDVIDSGKAQQIYDNTVKEAI